MVSKNTYKQAFMHFLNAKEHRRMNSFLAMFAQEPKKKKNSNLVIFKA